MLLLFLSCCQGEEYKSCHIYEDGYQDPEDHLSSNILAFEYIFPDLYDAEHTVCPSYRVFC